MPMADNKDGEKHRGREAQAMKKIGRPRILQSPEQLDALGDESAQQCRDKDEPLTHTCPIPNIGAWKNIGPASCHKLTLTEIPEAWSNIRSTAVIAPVGTTNSGV